MFLFGLLIATINFATAIDSACLSESGTEIFSFEGGLPFSNRDEILAISGGNHLYAFRKCELDGEHARIISL